MKNYLFYLRARSGAENDFKSWCLEQLGPEIAKSEGCQALRMNIGVEPIGGGTLYANEARAGEDFHVAFDLATEDEAAFQRIWEQCGPEIDARASAYLGYEVTTSIELDKADELRGNPTPGYKIMRGFLVYDDLPKSAFERSWNVHVNLAKKIHGFSRYVRYFIEKSVTPGAPPIRGATALYFASAEDLHKTYFLTPDGQETIKHDISHFIEKGLARIFTREHVLK